VGAATARKRFPESSGNGHGNGRFHLRPAYLKRLGSLPPRTKFKAGTTEAEVVRQHPVSRETVVRYKRNGASKGVVVRSAWSPEVFVEVVGE